MKVSMGPPPSRNPQLSNSVDTQNELSNPEKFKVPMGPPPPRNLQISDSDSNASVDNQNEVANSQEFKIPMGPPPLRNPQGFSTDTCAYEDPQNELSNSEKFKVPMGPPPARNPQLSNPDSNLSIDTHFELSNSEKVKVPIGSPPPRSTNLPKTDANSPPAETQIDAQLPLGDDKSTHIVEPIEKALDETETESKHGSTTASDPSLSVEVEVPYTIPPWSEPPMYPFFLEVLKDGSIIDQFNVHEKGAYMFGRVDLCDFVLEHPSISRFHAVLQFKKNGDAYLYDLGSTHGTSVNKIQVKKKVYTELHVGDVIRFGQSSRLYIFQGPSELMPQEGNLRNIRNSKIREEMQDLEASLLRAKQEASLADGISWGISEDAIEEIEEDADEVTWQTYKGQLTEKQEKTREKIIKRMEKIANMKKEIGAIRVKDISQGGLTQGQQTQIARNEQRISQIMEELENLEETLNESIQESIGARVGKIHHGKKKAAAEDEEVLSDDDDEFYDRTKKKPALQKTSEQQSIETADTLLDKKATIIKEMDDKKKLLQYEKSRDIPKTEDGTEVGDPLDAYMSGLSSQLVLDASAQLEKELSSLQSELDRVLYLLRISDPTGEAMKRRESRAQESKSKRPEISISTVKKRLPMEQKKASISEKPKNGFKNEETPSSVAEATKDPEAEIIAAEATETQKTIYTVTKPQWLGAIKDTKVKEVEKREASIDMHESDQFVDYKDRKKVLGDMDGATDQMKSEIEVAAPGLIIRKRKQIEKPGGSNNEDSEQSTSSAGSETTAAEAVALLLKHKRGYYTSDSEGKYESKDIQGGTQSKKEKKPRRVLGPQRPPFLDSNPDYESWVPPEGQSGDGRTSLNDRYGY